MKVSAGGVIHAWLSWGSEQVPANECTRGAGGGGEWKGVRGGQAALRERAGESAIPEVINQ